MYRGSNIFKGTVVLGNIIKLLRGKIGIFFGRLFMSEAKLCWITVIPIFWLWGFSVERT